MSKQIIGSVALETEECCKCGMIFAMPKAVKRKRREDHAYFYCPNGHGQYYTGKTEVEKLKDQVAQKERELSYARADCDDARRERDHANNRARAQKAAKTRIKNRIKNGVCPFCNRHFENLERHMQSRHADCGQEAKPE